MSIARLMQQAASSASPPDYSFDVEKIPYGELGGWFNSWSLSHPNAIVIGSNSPIEFFSNGKDYLYSSSTGELLSTTTSVGLNVKYAVTWGDASGVAANTLKPASYPTKAARLNPDMSKLYEVTASGTQSFYQYTWRVNQFNLSTSGDISSADSGTNTLYSFGGTTGGMPIGMAFGSSGSKFYLLRFDRVLREFNLGTAYDLTSTVTDSLNTLDLNSLGSLVTSVDFANNGTLLLVGYTDKVATYDLSTAWDISSAVYNSATSGSGLPSVVSGVSLNPDGTKMFLGRDSYSKRINEYSLSTAYDISTATYVLGKNLSKFDHGAVYENNGSSVLFYGSNGMAIEHLETPYTMPLEAYLYSTVLPSGDALDIRVGNNDSKVYVSSTSGYIYQYSNGDNTSVGLAYDNKSLDVSAHMNVNSTDGGRFCISGQGTKIVHLSGNTVKQWALSTAWDISTATLDGSYSLPSLPTIPNTNYLRGVLAYATDGSQLYVFFGVSESVGALYVYNLGTNWDASTATFSYSTSPPCTNRFHMVRLYPHEASQSILFGLGNQSSLQSWLVPTANDLTSCGWYGKIHYLSGEVAPNDAEDRVYFSDRVSYNTYRVRSYSLSTPGDLATASLDSVTSSNISYVSLGFELKCYDDTNLYTVSASGPKAVTGVMSTPGDLSTLTLDTTKTFPISSYRASTISRDGLSIYHTYSLSYLYRTPLSVAWDVSTAGTTTGSLSLNTFINSLNIDGPSEDRDAYLFHAGYDNTIRRRPKDGAGYWQGYDQITPQVIFSKDYSASGVQTNLPSSDIRSFFTLNGGSSFVTTLGSLLGSTESVSVVLDIDVP